MVKIGMATIYGVMGMFNQLDGTNAIGGVIGGYLMGTVGIAIYNKIKNHKKVDISKAKEIGADIAVLACKVVAPNMTKYAENKVAIGEGKKQPAKTRKYNKGEKFYYKDLANLFYMSQDDMIQVLRKYVLDGQYPTVTLKNGEWGEYKESKDGKIYIMYNTEMVEYLKIMLAK